jgi:hypothetical protein
VSDAVDPGTPAPATRAAKVRAILVYSLLRLALLAAVWLVVELVTPIHGVWAVAAALLMSGAISVVVLDRPRGEVGTVAAGFFGRINARIDASARAEDVDDPDDVENEPVRGSAAPVPGSGDGEQQAEHDAVDKQ